MQTLVSIITPVKNVSKWIEETHLSIQKQTLKEWEWIIIDDHSSDDTWRKIQEYATLDTRVQCYKATEIGIIPALQLAFSLAKGKFITRMDGDDLMPSNRLQLMVNQASICSKQTIITGKVSYFSENKISEGYLKYEQWLNDLVDNKNHYDHLYRECIVASPNWLMHHSVAKEIGLFEQLKYPEDYDMCFHWKKNNLDIHALAQTTLYWREHPERTSRNNDNYQQEAFFQLKLDWFNKNYPTESIGILGFGTKGKLASKILEVNNRLITIYVQDTETLQNSELKQFKKVDAINTDLLLISIYPPNLSFLTQQLAQKGYIIGENAFYL